MGGGGRGPRALGPGSIYIYFFFLFVFHVLIPILISMLIPILISIYIYIYIHIYIAMLTENPLTNIYKIPYTYFRTLLSSR